MARPLLVLALALASTAAAQDGIWGPPLPRRPFDAEAFRPVLPPAWVRETTDVGYTLSEMDAKGRAEAASHGVSISEVNFVDPFYDLDATARHAKPDDDVPLREETVPIHDIRVTFAPRHRLARARLEPDGIDLKVEEGPDGATVIVPRLDVHAMVVGELRP